MHTHTMLPVNLWILSYLIQSPISKRKNISTSQKQKKVRHSEQVQVVSNKKHILNPTIQLPGDSKRPFWFPKKVTKNCQPSGSLKSTNHPPVFPPVFPSNFATRNIVQVSLQKGSEHCPGTSSMSLPCERTVAWESRYPCPPKRPRERLGTSWKIDHPKDKGRINPSIFGHERLEAQKKWWNLCCWCFSFFLWVYFQVPAVSRIKGDMVGWYPPRARAQYCWRKKISLGTLAVGEISAEFNRFQHKSHLRGIIWNLKKGDVPFPFRVMFRFPRLFFVQLPVDRE